MGLTEHGGGGEAESLIKVLPQQVCERPQNRDKQVPEPDAYLAVLVEYVVESEFQDDQQLVAHGPAQELLGEPARDVVLGVSGIECLSNRRRGRPARVVRGSAQQTVEVGQRTAVELVDDRDVACHCRYGVSGHAGPAAVNAVMFAAVVAVGNVGTPSALRSIMVVQHAGRRFYQGSPKVGAGCRSGKKSCGRQPTAAPLLA
ncbi:hypothetical protein [Amycolatopsis sp. PS_44_ISF1]|uniref:hypothetical protein n=1 Tax=Amycolatopsis sp. PS_44_ISF1 TaxID=2974917 RepID=UPI0028DD9687|nr:hypothetical protein [Amycolatopsis sp. PS_44_ISF1]MDT8912250.1 hypothetical protein [Amycolatopsis sp. PS_44_ISF1]